MSKTKHSEFSDNTDKSITLGMYYLVKALKGDMLKQGRIFRTHTFAREVRKVMTLRNGNCIRNGMSRGQTIINKDKWLPHYGHTRECDLAAVIIYTLEHEGYRDWPATRKFVASKLPEEFKGLVDLEYSPKNSEERSCISIVSPLVGEFSLAELKVKLTEALRLTNSHLSHKPENEETK